MYRITTTKHSCMASTWFTATAWNQDDITPERRTLTPSVERGNVEAEAWAEQEAVRLLCRDMGLVEAGNGLYRTKLAWEGK